MAEPAITEPREVAGEPQQSVVPDCRYERKFAIDGDRLAEARLLIRLHPECFRMVYPPRFVNSLYFDTTSWSYYRSHVYGNADRKKVRLRWYGPLDYNGPVRLEVKSRCGLIGWKTVYSIDDDGWREECGSAVVLRRLFAAAGVPESHLLESEMLHPTTLVRYRREYWRAADWRFRVTLDSDIQYFCAGNTRVRWNTSPPAQEHRVIMELKYPIDGAERAESVTRQWPFRVIRNSKYINAVRCLYGL